MSTLLNKLNNPAVSFVISLLCNKGKYGEREISSVLARTHHADEIIVEDGGSYR